MSTVNDQALQKYAKIINSVEDTKEAIIKTAEFDDKYRELQKIQQEKRQEETTEEDFEFDPNEIESLVSRKRFKEELSVNIKEIEKQQDYDDDFIKFEIKPNSNEEKEI